MITFFTDPYKDELIYSAIARYHYYVGNIDLRDTLDELLNTNTTVASLTLQCNLTALVNNLGDRYSEDDIINNNTIFPFYIPFLPEERRVEVLNNFKYDNGLGIFNKVGISAGGICKKDGIHYCPSCAKKDIEFVGEPYIHREHQLEGILVCPHDGERLKKYVIERTTLNKKSFIRLDEEKLDYSSLEKYKSNFQEKLLILAKGAYFLFQHDLSFINQKKLTDKYINILYKKGFATHMGYVRQRELHEAFIRFYGNEFLELLESNIDIDFKDNWLKGITRNKEKITHPIRHLLLIYFLCGDIKTFFHEFDGEFYPFGKGPWVCLNKASNHYKKNVITDLTIRVDQKTKNPCGTFTCNNCGFIYSRTGPDKYEMDKYKIGKIIEYGHQWEEKLKEYIQSNEYMIKEIAEKMGCSRQTIYRSMKKIKSNKQRGYKTNLENRKQIIVKYRECILKNKIKYKTRTELMNNYIKEFSYLRKYDKEWLYDNLPETNKTESVNYRVDWNSRDLELVKLLEDNYPRLLNSEIPTQISINYFIRELKIKESLFRNLNKLPKTKEYLGIVCETTREFQIRRCKKIIDVKKRNGESIRLWEIQRLGGVATKDFNFIKSELLEYIHKEE